jgi:hypothetical protein
MEIKGSSESIKEYFNITPNNDSLQSITPFQIMSNKNTKIKPNNILNTRLVASFTLNPNMATIIFKCKSSTNLGETVRLVGNIEELGCWEPSKSLKMATNESVYPIWESTTEITGPVGMEISYKYVKHDEKQDIYHWEEFNQNVNRKFVISSDGIFVISDEVGNINSSIQRIVGAGVISNNNPQMDSNSFISHPASEESNLQEEDQKFDNFDCLSYDSKSLNSTENPFFFCMNQKISSDDRIIIASAHLPIEVDKTPDDNFLIRVIDESLIYSILYGMKEKEISEVIWVGMLKNFSHFSEKDLEKIKDFLRDRNIFLITLPESDYKNYWIYMNHILIDVFVNTAIDINK